TASRQIGRSSSACFPDLRRQTHSSGRSCRNASLAARCDIAASRLMADTTAMDAPDVRFAKSGDISIAYATVGDGPFDVVFVNGWVLSALEHAWEGPAADFFRELASFSRLILFDKRGTG